jgi:NAD+ diphosphatase
MLPPCRRHGTFPRRSTGEPPVQPIRPSRKNAYTGNPLDRVSKLRDDEAAIAAALADERARFLPVWRSRNLLATVEGNRHEAAFLAAAAIPPVEQHPIAFLGFGESGPVFAIDLSDVEDPATLLPSELGAMLDLRNVSGLLPGEHASMLAHARGLMHWRSRNKFCGVCGGATEPRSAGHMLLCAQCGTQHFPRTDPAVIMLVAHGDRALLGHSQRFPNSTVYSTLAGFVEPGESLEEAVAREVFEESGVRVGDVYYHSSQPWPFPGNIMLGFHAEALTTEITIDPDELTDARWFSRDELRDPESAGISLPRAESIARRLIEDWIAAG